MSLVPLVETALLRALARLRGARGGLIGFDARGEPRVIAPGTDGHAVLYDSAAECGITSGPAGGVNLPSKGDLAVGLGSGSVGVCGVGADGRVLTARSSESTGMAWEVPSSRLVEGSAVSLEGLTDSRTTASSYGLIAWELLLFRGVKLTALEAVLPPTSTCVLRVDGVERGTETNSSGSHAAATYTLAGGGLFLEAGVHWVEVVRSSGTSQWRDAGDQGGINRVIPFGGGVWALRNTVYYGTGYSNFNYAPPNRIAYVPYTWSP